MNEITVEQSWDEFAEETMEMALRLYPLMTPDTVVVVILHGAHSPWALLSRVLPHKKVLYVPARRYREGETTSSEKVQVMSFPDEKEFWGQDVLIFDEVGDEGHTLDEFRIRVEDARPVKVRTAVLAWKRDNWKFSWVPDVHITKIPGNVYRDFPWETWEKMVRAALAARASQLAAAPA